MSDLLNIEKRRKRQEAIDGIERNQLHSDLINVFSSESGRRVLRWIFSVCEIYSDHFTGDERTYYGEGKRSVGLELLDEILLADKNIYINVLKETDYGE